AVLGLIGVIPFVYGVISILLASLMGRRSPAVLWSVVVFQALAALLLLVNIFSGALAGSIPLVFAIVMFVLMLLEGTRAHYSRSSEDFRAHCRPGNADPVGPPHSGGPTRPWKDRRLRSAVPRRPGARSDVPVRERTDVLPSP